MGLSSTERRPIRSFVRREGRMTPAQKRALEELWPRYGVENVDAPLDLAALFGRTAPVILEIGFGNGEALAALAARHPENDYLGIEVHRPGVGHLLNCLAAQQSTNVRVLVADARETLVARIPDESLAGVHLFFPDPWPKKRHHKRRLVQPDFAQLVRRKLETGGVFHLATDWHDYAQWMMETLTVAEGFENLSGPGSYSERGERPLTKFERRGERLGHAVHDLRFRRVG
jgi:tRNA (guanine-N7-)-methyltransferase